MNYFHRCIKGEKGMTERSVFVSKNVYPFVEEIKVNCEWFGGFALSQKRKCEIGLHRNFLRVYPNEKILEISMASINPLGKKLSAMNLKKRVYIMDKKKGRLGITSVESAFQSSRVFTDGETQIGPFPNYLMVPGKESKKRVKELAQGMHSYKYEFEKEVFYAPNYHISLFYDYLYLNALLEDENRDVMLELISGGYSAFSDLATVSLNCQARSCAIFIGLFRAGLLDKVKSKNMYLELFRTREDGTAALGAYENVQVFCNGKVDLLSPVVPNFYQRNEIEEYYSIHFGHLSNKKIHDEFIPYWVT